MKTSVTILLQWHLNIHSLKNEAFRKKLIFLVNDIVDPYYDWPLNDESFDSYMRTLYGSTAKAKTTIYEYRKIINNQSVRFDGKMVPKRTVVVD